MKGILGLFVFVSTGFAGQNFPDLAPVAPVKPAMDSAYANPGPDENQSF